MERWSTPLCVLAVLVMGVAEFVSLAVADGAKPVVSLQAGSQVTSCSEPVTVTVRG